MGLGTESAMLKQLKKSQGETNERLDRIAELIERLAAAIEKLTQQQAPPRSPR